MLDNGRISPRQLTILVTLVTIGDPILVLPAIQAAEAKQDAWISGIIGMVAGLAVVWLLCLIGKLFPRLSLVQSSETILGRWVGTPVSLLLLLYYLLNATIMVREIGDFMTTHIMPETPIEAIHVLYLVILIMGVRLGLETLARAGEILFPWFVTLFVTLVISLLPQVELTNIQPVLEEGLKPVIRGSIPSVAFPFMELVCLAMVLPYVNQPKETTRSFLLGATLGGIALIIMIALCILVLGPDFTARQIYPTYTLAKKISIAEFFERMEAILAIMWILTLYFKISIYYYAFHMGLAHLLRLKEYRMLALPMGMVLAVFAIVVSPNIAYYNEVISKYWPYLDLTMSVMLPMLLIGVYAIRKRFTNSNNDA